MPSSHFAMLVLAVCFALACRVLSVSGEKKPGYLRISTAIHEYPRKRAGGGQARRLCCPFCRSFCRGKINGKLSGKYHGKRGARGSGRGKHKRRGSAPASLPAAAVQTRDGPRLQLPHKLRKPVIVNRIPCCAVISETVIPRFQHHFCW